MTVRRWEVWLTCRFGLEPHEQRVSRHVFKITARLFASMEPTRNTLAVTEYWNRLWPTDKISQQRWEVRRAS